MASLNPQSKSDDRTVAKLSKIINPMIFAVFPIFYIFSVNIRDVRFGEIVLPLLVSLLSALILFLLLKYVLSSAGKASIITCAFLMLFFSYGYLYEVILDVSVFEFTIGRARYLLLAYIIIATLIVYFVARTQRDLSMLNSFLIVAGSAMFLTSAITVVLFQVNHVQTGGQDVSQNEVASTTLLSAAIEGERMPDIYYFILDAYGRVDILQEFYDYDNSAFIEALTQKGFYVAAKSRSNFAYTVLSIASSINMEYPSFVFSPALRDTTFDDSTTSERNTANIKNNRVAQFLKGRGYDYIYFRSLYGDSEFADINLRGGTLNEFSMLLFNTTLFRTVALFPSLYKMVLGDIRGRTLYQFEQLERISAENSSVPRFVFVHFLPPHPPFVFGPDGGYAEDLRSVELKLEFTNVGWDEREKQQYIDQVVFMNKKILDLINSILSNSDTPPIIVIQGDHGPWSSTTADHQNEDLIRERMSILNAYYLPNMDDEILYDSITPVNTFRLIFNNYFSANFPLLDEKNWFSHTVISGEKTPYNFIDVTETIQ